MSDNFTDADLKILQQIFSEVKSYSKEIKVAKQVREIEPIDKWLENDYYVGESGLYLYDYWKDVMSDVFDEKSEINELIITGGLGVGKSVCALYCIIRKIYELSCFTNIPRLFNLMPRQLISFMYFSVNRVQAELTGFGQIKSFVDNIPYFKENFTRNEKVNDMLIFPENLLLVSGSNQNHSIGMSLIGCILDEANFFGNDSQNVKTKQDYSKVSALYSSIRNRAASRFATAEKDSSLSVLVSSNTTTSSFTSNQIERAQNDPHTKVVNARLWEVKPKGQYSKEVFYVFIGNSILDPTIVDTYEDLDVVCKSNSIMTPKYNTLKENIDCLPSYLKELLIPVPVTPFRSKFEADINMALQDIAGVSVAPSGRLFSSRELYAKACSENSLTHPFTKDEFTLSTGDNINFLDYIKPTYIPLCRNKSRFVHFDQSFSKDATGIGSCFIYGTKEVEGVVKPVIAVDMIARIIPPKVPDKISISKCRRICYIMRDVWNLPIEKVTYDQFQSQSSIEELQKDGFSAGRISVDKDETPYLEFINMIYEGRILMYRHPQVTKELFDLIYFRDKRKIDHPDGGCFSEDTEIRLANNKKLTIKELANSKESFKVYGCNKFGKIIEAECSKAFYTKTVNKLLEITLSNGKKIKCTPEHLFMRKDMVYVKAEDLFTGYPLFSEKTTLVLSVKEINGSFDVYDLTVPETSNFMLDCGVIVHNSKDVMDGIVGAVYSAVDYYNHHSETTLGSEDKGIFFDSSKENGFLSINDFFDLEDI